MSGLPDVSPYLATADEVGVCLTLPDGGALYLTAEQWDQLSIEADDALCIDPAELHSANAAQSRLDELRNK